jgi:hypothetical protein
MDLFDEFFNKEKNGIDKAMDDAFDNFVENNPFMKKAKSRIEEAANMISSSLEEEAYGQARERPEGQPSIMDSFDSRSREWDSMTEQIVAKELRQYKVCPSCNEAVPAGYDTCPYCRSPLPDHTAEFWTCKHCGAKNRTMYFYCENCGKKSDIFPEEEKNDEKIEDQ